MKKKVLRPNPEPVYYCHRDRTRGSDERLIILRSIKLGYDLFTFHVMCEEKIEDCGSVRSWLVNTDDRRVFYLSTKPQIKQTKRQ